MTAVTDEERDPSKRAPGRKDKNYCKPARGPHRPILVVRPYGGKTPTCGWKASWSVKVQGWEPNWTCFHEEECAECGKWFRHLGETDCPDWRPVTPQEEAAIGVRIAEMAGAAGWVGSPQTGHYRTAGISPQELMSIRTIVPAR